MKTQHTPGPWYYRPDGRFIEAQTAGGYNFAISNLSARNLSDSAEIQANAKLIASAPDLLAALEECIAWFDLDPQRNHLVMAQDTEIGFRMIQAARAAVAKAKGDA